MGMGTRYKAMVGCWFSISGWVSAGCWDGFSMSVGRWCQTLTQVLPRSPAPCLCPVGLQQWGNVRSPLPPPPPAPWWCHREQSTSPCSCASFASLQHLQTQLRPFTLRAHTHHLVLLSAALGPGKMQTSLSPLLSLAALGDVPSLRLLLCSQPPLFPLVRF